MCGKGAMRVSNKQKLMVNMIDLNSKAGIILPLKRRNYALLKTRKNPAYIKYLPNIVSKPKTKLKAGNIILSIR